MSRLLILVIALLLPAQWVWSAASAYCQHESGGSSQHFGHHVHAHVGEPKKSSDSKLAPDADCGSCQAAHTPLMASVSEAIALIASVNGAAALAAPPFSSALARAPDRPQWLRLV
jgi:hypothetical protein